MGYDYGIIDAQWLLARNYFAIKGNYDQLPSNGSAMIASSVISSLIKFTEEHNFRKIILLFDTYPYHKHEILAGDYKSSRTYTTDEMVDEEEDPVQKRILEIDRFNLNQRGKAKWILKELGAFGMPSFYKKGYEADDLAYLVSNRIQELGQTGLLVSIDSDWNYWINPSVDWYSPNRGITTYQDTMDELGLPKNLSLFDYKIHYDSFYGSHNDFYQTVTDENWNRTFVDFYKEFSNTDNKASLFKDYNLYKKQIDAMDIHNYPGHQKASSMMYYLDKTGGIPSKGMYEEWRTKKLITVPDWRYWKLVEKLSPELYYD